MTEIWTAIIGAVGVLATAIFGYLGVLARQKKLDLANKEMSLQSAALDFSRFISEWSLLQEELKNLMRDTCIDRFLILRAWNGMMTPKWTTAIFQYRQGDQEPIQYVHFELDNDYVERIMRAVQQGPFIMNVDEARDSAIRSVYLAEGVQQSAWFHLDTSKLPGSDAAAITYCTFATHEKDAITPDVMTRCWIISDRLKGVVVSFQS